MLKMMAHGTRDGKPVTLVFLGLSHGNLDRLREGRPIRVEGAAVGLPGVEIMIFSGETEHTMQREIAQFIGPSTGVHIDPRLRD